MALASLLTLLDDIVSVLDDVALMGKMAAKKTAGVVGDDLALNANQVTGVQTQRELPVVWAVAKGSLVNKLILIPVALLLSWFLPVLIVPLLMIGGAYLCFEGAEKIWHRIIPSHDEHEAVITDELPDERDKIRGAIRTDFILSAEIIIIALDVVANASLSVRVMTLFLIGIGMTVLVYGLVALIVKADDFGLYLMRREHTAPVGRAIIAAMPLFMRLLAVVGTVAMFLVGGGIFTHYLAPLHHWLHAQAWDAGWMAQVAALATGLAVGALVLSAHSLVGTWRKRAVAK